MPIYAYRCAACGHAQDVLQKMSDPVLSSCPACGAARFEKQLTAAGFQLKGSGWYVTDFRGGQAGAAKDAEGKGAEAKGGETKGADGKGPADAAKAEAKPAASASATPAAKIEAKASAAATSGAAPGSGAS